MKKIILLSSIIFSTLLCKQLFGDEFAKDSRFSTALTAGFVFKNGREFKEVYGWGIPNLITADFCYYHWQQWGIGTKVSYWRAKGETTFLKQRTHLQEVPFTLYVRRKKDFDCGIQIYASLGGGFIWLKEKSYLGDAKLLKGIGEAEVGFYYPIWRCINFTSAFRYLFPNQSYCDVKKEIGGSDLRFGLEFEF